MAHSTASQGTSASASSSSVSSSTSSTADRPRPDGHAQPSRARRHYRGRRRSPRLGVIPPLPGDAAAEGAPVKAPAGLMKAPSKDSHPKNGDRASKTNKTAKAEKASATPSGSSGSTAATSAVAPPGGNGLTPERQRRRRRRQVNRQSELRYVLPTGLLYSTKKGDLDPKYRVLAKTHHVYTVTESRENLAREAFERLCREMGANAALNVTTRELAETYNHKVYRRFEIKGIPAIVGEVSTSPGAMSRSLAIKAFPRPAVVREYQQRAQEHQSAKGKIRSDEGFERMDRSVAQQVLFAIFVILALLATVSYIPW